MGHGKLLLWRWDSGYAALVGWHAHWYMGSLVVRKAPSEGGEGGHVLKPDELTKSDEALPIQEGQIFLFR